MSQHFIRLSIAVVVLALGSAYTMAQAPPKQEPVPVNTPPVPAKTPPVPGKSLPPGPGTIDRRLPAISQVPPSIPELVIPESMKRKRP
jgi:hypothetical protein